MRTALEKSREAREDQFRLEGWFRMSEKPSAAAFFAKYTCKVYGYCVIHRVVLTKRAEKELRAVPTQVARKLMVWIETVEADGLEEVRRVPGFHDEPLKGERAGQRSIRLSRAYRAIYRLLSDGTAEFVSVEEVNKHDY